MIKQGEIPAGQPIVPEDGFFIEKDPNSERHFYVPEVILNVFNKKGHPLDGSYYLDKHQGAAVEESATAGRGVVLGNRVIICAKTHLDSEVTVGASAIIEDNVRIGHKSVIGANSVICRETTVKQNAVIGDTVFIGPGSVIGQKAVFGSLTKLPGRSKV